MNVTEYLSEQGVKYELHEHPPAYTAQEAAAEEHVSGHDFAKPVLIRADGKYALCVLQACHRLDMAKVARALGSAEATLADERELAERFPDAEVGAEPPFGNLYDLPTLVDRRLADDEVITFQAGDHEHAVRMRFDDYARLAEPEKADLAVEA